MGTPEDRKPSAIADLVKSWILQRKEPANMSRDFWMPDHSCRVCYDCDSQFTVFNRRHHCRLCGRVFCAKCTTNSVPAPSDEFKSGREDGDRIRVCNYCFKQWNQGTVGENPMMVSSPGLSSSPSSLSLISNQSSCYTCNSCSSAGSAAYATGPFQQISPTVGQSSCQSVEMDPESVREDRSKSDGKIDYLNTEDTFTDQFGSCSRSDEEDDDDYPFYRSHSTDTLLSPDMCSATVTYGHGDHINKQHAVHPTDQNTCSTCDSESAKSPENTETHLSDCAREIEGKPDVSNSDAPSGPPHSEVPNDAHLEPVDYENNGLLWLPPEPEDEEDERENLLSEDDDDDTNYDASEKWGYLQSHSSDVGESRSRDRSTQEHRQAMKTVVDGHFRALITQLLQAENLQTDEDNMEESWLDIITSLSLDAANFLKPDTSTGGGMDPGGYVKVKCLASGRRSQSMVVKGVVCKKNVAHRRMTSKINKPRMLLLGGALEYQRVPNHLSSFDTLLQQEMDHLRMAVAKIEAHHPNILLVERSVSRYAQDYLLAKDISLVLNVKRQLLERIARCTGAQIVPSIDNLSSTKLGYCDSFHVDKFLEDLGSAGQAGKKLTKTLMFFEGCPRPLGCTILLKGASGDELKKVKHVVQYGVFAAYHLALETSFLADEGARLPELPLTSPIKVALPGRPSNIDRSISMIPGYNDSSEKPQGSKDPTNSFQSMNDLFLDIGESSKAVPMSDAAPSQSESAAKTPKTDYMKDDVDCTKYCSDLLDPHLDKPFAIHKPKDGNSGSSGECFVAKEMDYLDEAVRTENIGSAQFQNLVSDQFYMAEDSGVGFSISYDDDRNKQPSNLDSSELNSDDHGELGPFKEDFPQRSDQQSILVSLSSRCVQKGVVCERSHLLRIKYYGNFDRPLGRFLQDQLFDQVYRCHSCEMPAESHIHCYTHQQGSLTISVRKLPGFLLAGEREGKIWMWHRCLRCPRINGFPPATKRVLMSDAAWGLSFGKFLELSFSNHAAASRVATCGHSIHRDCLRFYGLGRMVACFHYAPIVVHSVYLPPPAVEFNYYEQEWIQKDLDEVRLKATHLFAEVLKAIHQISAKDGNGSSAKPPDTGQRIVELKLMFQMEKKEFEESMWGMLNDEVKSGKPAVDILEMNRLRKKLVFLAYVWDQRLIHTPRSRVPNKSISSKETPVNFREKHAELNVVSRPGRGFSSWDCSLVDFNPDVAMTEAGQSRNNSPHEIHGGIDKCGTLISERDLDPRQSFGLDSNSHSESLKSIKAVRRAQSQGHFAAVENLSDNIDTEWAGNQWREHVASDEKAMNTSPQVLNQVSSSNSTTELAAGPSTKDSFVGKELYPPRSELPIIDASEMENPSSWVRIPFSFLYESLNKISSDNAQKLGMINTYIPVYITSLRDLLHVGGARLLLPVASGDIILPVYDDEPTSVIAYALTSPDYQNFMSEAPEKPKPLGSTSSFSILESVNLLSLNSFEDIPSESTRSVGSADQSFLSSASRGFSGLDPLLFSDSLHARVSFSDEGPPGKVKYSVTCYFAKQFEALRRVCCASELDFVLSLSRCKKWGAQGGKSNVFFAKTLDDRFIIKQVTKTELESFIKFASYYFRYLTESISTGCPTCLAKVLGIYQVTSKHIKGGKESKMDVLVMENLLFRRSITRLYDLKGSSRSRYNPDSSGSNKVLLDQNLIEAMPTSPIFLGTKAKRLLERAVWNDTAFLASIDVMDYSLLVGVDSEKHELVLGIIDFMRQYTWDKHLETWVKASGILGGPKNASPTVISPKQYKKRFRKAMSAYFLMVPDQWSSSLNLSSDSKSDVNEEN